MGTVHAILAAVCYSGFLFLLRRGGHGGQHVRQSYLDVTVAAAVVSLGVGAVWHGIDLTPGWAAVGWLFAVSILSQVIGWLLFAVFSPRIPSHIGAILLLLTPVGAVVLCAIVLGERPSLVQLAGCVLILASAYFGTARRTPRSGGVSARRFVRPLR